MAIKTFFHDYDGRKRVALYSPPKDLNNKKTRNRQTENNQHLTQDDNKFYLSKEKR